MEFEHELYAERLRRKAQAEALTAGEVQWATELNRDVRIKLAAAWTDALSYIPHEYVDAYKTAIQRRTTRSLARALTPSAMNTAGHTDEDRLSLIEAEHEALKAASDEMIDQGSGLGSVTRAIIEAPERLRQDVNRIFEAHLVGFHLHENSRLVPIDSHEMHNAVVAPVLYLLRSQPQFAAAETAYQNALKELRNRDPGDAITDAATALQEVLIALGCTGGALGDLISSARKKGLVAGADTPLTESIVKTVNWVATQRNQGEAHRAEHTMNMSDAWMVVHVVGALAIRLAEASTQPET